MPCRREKFSRLFTSQKCSFTPLFPCKSASVNTNWRRGAVCGLGRDWHDIAIEMGDEAAVAMHYQ
eukprot:5289717-Prymnesium_polylepis.1